MAKTKEVKKLSLKKKVNFITYQSDTRWIITTPALDKKTRDVCQLQEDEDGFFVYESPDNEDKSYYDRKEFTNDECIEVLASLKG